jgi:hypothetical protein
MTSQNAWLQLFQLIWSNDEENGFVKSETLEGKRKKERCKIIRMNREHIPVVVTIMSPHYIKTIVGKFRTDQQ